MKRLAVCLLAFGLLFAEPPASVWSQAKGARVVLTDVIDPDASLFGMPYGLPKKQVTDLVGDPMGELTLGNGLTLLVFPGGKSFVFEGGLLAGAVVQPYFLPFSLELLGDTRKVSFLSWRMPSGISAGSKFQDYLEAVGMTEGSFDPRSTFRHNSEKSSFVVTFDRANDTAPESRKRQDFEGDDEFLLNSLMVGRPDVIDRLGFKSGDAPD